MVKRMFTAVLPPASVVQELDAWLQPRREADSELRWTRPEGWHLTTAFLAQVSHEREEALEQNLAEVAARTDPFRVAIGGAICFPHPDKARIVGLGVPEGHDELAALSAACRTAASRAGVEADGARFVGHLTLARNNRGISATRWLTVFDAFPRWSWVAKELVLIESRNTGHGYRYEVAARLALGQRVVDAAP